MQEIINAGEDVLVFYNDKASFNAFAQIQQENDIYINYDEKIANKLLKLASFTSVFEISSSLEMTTCNNLAEDSSS